MITSATANKIPEGSPAQQVPDYDAYDNMKLGDFVKLLTVEMQNQDPMNPMENSEILQQISQIRAIASNDKMSTTLTSLKLQQDMVSGSAMLNQTVKAVDVNGLSITGKVDKVTLTDNKVQLHIGEHTVDLTSIAEINPSENSDDQIAESLASMQLQQDIQSGNSLLNQAVKGKDAKGKEVTGKVEKVTVSGGKVKLQIGENSIDLGGVTEVNGSTVAAVQNQQNLISGSALLYRLITGKNAKGETITGYVDQVSVEGDKVELHIGENIIDLDNITNIHSSLGTNTETEETEE
jgi:flagellar basal-body rod modification protein FlgD